MARIEQIHRLLYIAELLKSRPTGINYEETRNFLEEKFEEKGFELKFSEKTFKRDRTLISEFLGIESKYKKALGTFAIIKDEQEQESKNTLEDILLIEAYRKSKKDSEIILFEKREPKGLYHFSDFVDAIKKHRIISFSYQKFYENKPEKRVVVPYALKESQNRWYLLAVDRDDSRTEGKMPVLKSFGLDRISNAEIHHTRQLRFLNLIEKSFEYSFGISSTLHEEPVEIVLSFSPHQGKYVKSLPLHASQKILIDSNDELRISVTIYPTFDFMQEILSHGSNVTIISPNSYREEFLRTVNKILENYK